MLKNITLSADEQLLQLAKNKAKKSKSTLNVQFREWLQGSVNTEIQMFDYDALIIEMSYVNAGKKFSREEMNER